MLIDCDTAGLSKRVTSFTLTNECGWQEDQSLPLDQPPKSTACQHNFQAMLHDAQQVYAAAEQVVRQSCREDWLLQPYIPDIQEYRQVRLLHAWTIRPMHKQNGKLRCIRLAAVVEVLQSDLKTNQLGNIYPAQHVQMSKAQSD